MFNIDHLYGILHAQLLSNKHLQGHALKKFNKCDSNNDILKYPDSSLFYFEDVYFYDQEPFGTSISIPQSMYDVVRELQDGRWDLKYNIWATSENNNPLLNAFCSKNNLIKWYYFYHAFASLDWFRSVKYYPKVDVYKGASFISLNNLCTDSRVYRSLFVSKLYEQGLLGEGVVSYNIKDYNNNVYISNKDKKLIKRLADVNTSFRIQKTNYYQDNASAEVEYDLWTSSFWHVVSETCFYEKTNHLTEKIFKPIVSRQPFLLLGPTGNLEYLRSYGFKTFHQFIDESYDEEKDPSIRLDMVLEQIRYICNLSSEDKRNMYFNMLPILEHNFHHFYNRLFDICWQELLDNFEISSSKLQSKQKTQARHPNLSKIDRELGSYQTLPGNLGKQFRKKWLIKQPTD